MNRVVSASRVINADPHTIFEVLSDASLHPTLDGSGTVRASTGVEQRLTLGSKFAMKMLWGIPYTISSTVVEFEPDRRIAWAHLGKHRWRYQLEPHDDNSTLVIESFDYSTAVSPRALELIGAPKRNLASIERTLERLDAFVTHRSGALQP